MISIVLVDEHDSIRKLAYESLTLEDGYRVIGEARNTKEAGDMLERIQPEVLIADLFTNNPDSFELVRTAHQKYPEVKIIVWSVYIDEYYAIKAIEAGARGYVVKDSGIDTLKTAIREVMLGHLFMGPPLSKHKLEKYRHIMRNL